MEGSKTMEQRILGRVQKPWSNDSYGGLINQGANNLMEGSETMEQRIAWTAQNPGAKNFVDCSQPWSKESCQFNMEQIILWTAQPWSEESYRGLYVARDSMDCSEPGAKSFVDCSKQWKK